MISSEKNSSVNIDSDYKQLLLDLERISVGEHLFETVKCGLCYCVPGAPLILKCCENILCQMCNDSWKLKNHNNCPICRQANYNCSPPNRFEKNVFNSIKYFCSFKNNGCTEKNLDIEHIIPHEKKCEKNPNRIMDCDKCHLEYNPNNKHDCVESLLGKVKTLNEKLHEMESKMGNHAYIFKSLE